MINLTISHRLDADVRLPYGWVAKADRPWLLKLHHGRVISPHSKPKDVVWMVSHCVTPGKRELYADELAKHIRLDKYGTCGPYRCLNKSEECMTIFEEEYKFYLAFENDFCTDYITEKFFRTLDYDMIPIVYGGGNYKLLAPPHSYIDILDYPNPGDLAAYLKHLSEDAEAYAAYFKWKGYYEVENFRRTIYAHAFCQLCEILHNATYRYETQRYDTIDEWWMKDDTCDADRMRKLRDEGKW